MLLRDEQCSPLQFFHGSGFRQSEEDAAPASSFLFTEKLFTFRDIDAIMVD